MSGAEQARNWASVSTSKVVYVGIVDRAEFDRIELPATEHAAIAGLLPSEPARRCISKMAADATGLLVVFQHWVQA